MSGEDEKAVVASPEAEAGKAEGKTEETAEENQESDEEMAEPAENDKKKPVKRKGTPSKIKEDSAEEAEHADEDSEIEEKSPKKKRASPRKSPVKKPKKKDSSDEEEDEHEAVSSKKSPRNRATPKKSKPEDTGDVSEEDDEDEEGEEEVKKGVPLLDQPLEVVGARERRRVSRFEEEFNGEKDEKKPFEVPQGRGTKLGDISMIEYNISKYTIENLRPVSKALFGSRGPTKHFIKKAVRDFCGFDFDEKSESFEKRKVLINKMGGNQVRFIAEFLGLEKSGYVAVVCDRILSYCLKPKDSGKAPPAARSKRKSAAKASRKSYAESDESDGKPARSKRGKGKRKSLKDAVNSDTDGSVKQKSNSKKKRSSSLKDESSDNDKSEDEVTNETKSNESNDVNHENDQVVQDEEEPEEKPKKGKKPAPKKTKAPKSTPTKKTSKKKVISESEHEEEVGESSDEDIPLLKIVKSSPPSDEDIKSYVKKILEGANLEEITMKTVCKQVYEHYPEHDLAHKKELIKDTVKSLIST